MLNIIINLPPEDKIMTDIADNVIALQAAVAALPASIATAVQTAIAGIVIPAPVVDFTPVLTAITALGAKVDADTAPLQPTPPVSAPDAAPAAPAA